MDEITKRKMFQRVKNMTNKEFFDAMDILFSDAYLLSDKQWREAIFNALPPRYRKQVLEHLDRIRGYDGVREVEIEQKEQAQ